MNCGMVEGFCRGLLVRVLGLVLGGRADEMVKNGDGMIQWRASAEDCDRDGLDWRRLQRMGDERGLEWLLQRR